MSGGSKSPTVQTSSQSTQQVPQYVTDAQNALQGYGQSQLSPFLSSSPNYAVAGLNADQLTGFDLTRQLGQDAFSNSRPTNTASSYTPTMVGPANGYTAQGYSAQNYAPTYAGNGQGYAFAGSGGAATYDPRIAGNSQSYDATMGTAARTGGSDFKEFMNPYIQAVIDPAVANLRRQHDDTSAQIGAQAAAASSFGGSGEAIRQAQNDRAAGDQTATMVSQLMNNGYTAAQAIAQANTQLAQQSGLANQSAQNTASQYNANAADTMARSNAALINQAAQFNAGNIQADRQYNSSAANQAAQFGANANNTMAQFNAGASNTAGQFNTGANNTAAQFGANANNTAAQFLASAQNANDLFNAGAQNTAGYQNAGLGLQNAQFQNSMLNDEQQRRMAAIQAILGIGGTQQNLLQSILGVPGQSLAQLQGITPTTVPVNTSTVGTQPNTAPSLGQTLLGGALSIGGKFAGSSAGSALLGGLFACDARLKKDIAPYGMSEAGRPLFAFRYRWEDDDAPFTIGPMAQIEEENDPDSVVEVLGIKLVRVH